MRNQVIPALDTMFDLITHHNNKYNKNLYITSICQKCYLCLNYMFSNL